MDKILNIRKLYNQYFELFWMFVDLFRLSQLCNILYEKLTTFLFFLCNKNTLKVKKQKKPEKSGLNQKLGTTNSYADVFTGIKL